MKLPNLIKWWHDYRVRRAKVILYGEEYLNGEYVSPTMLKDVLYDFFKNYNGSLPQLTQTDAFASSTPIKKVDERIETSPKDVFGELERVPNPVDCDPQRLAMKIELMERKINLGIDQRFTKEHMQGMLDCLRNRLCYDKYKDFYEQFQYTTMEKIEMLLQKYKLCMREVTLFVPTFPDDATKVMEDYIAETRKLTNKRPVFYVIAKEEDFKKKYEKHDPILLVQSPFGFFWQILGAWDDEMLLLEEL